MKKSFSPDELPIVDGRIYHLDLSPQELARDVILVGDPDRVPLLADEFLEQREVDRFHRGFRTITGVACETGMRVSIVTSGIGAPSAEIVLNELVALNEIDFRAMARKKSFAPLTVIRIGTSGGLNPVTPLGALVLTDYVIGLDNTALFYDVPLPDAACAYLEEQAKAALGQVAQPGARFGGMIAPYAARADRELLAALEQEAAMLGICSARGITVSSPCFFAGQGRGLARIGSTVHGLLDVLERLKSDRIDLKVENIEMETGFLLHFMAGLGYRAAAVCAVINKRKEDIFMTDYRDPVLAATQIALRAFRRLTSEGLTGAFES